MTAIPKRNESLFSGEALGLKGRFFIEDLIENDRQKDLENYLSEFGKVKVCNINKEGNSMPHAVAQYQDLQSVDNLMQKKNRPHILNGHPIYIYRELRGIPNSKVYRKHRDIRILDFEKKTPQDIPIDELNYYFSQYGTVISIKSNKNNIEIIYDDYDSVDRAMLYNPHIFQGIPHDVKKCLPSLFSPQHHLSDPLISNVKRKHVDSQNSSIGSNTLSQNSSTITVINDSVEETPGRLFGKAISDVKEQVISDCPNDVPPEWTIKPSRLGEAGGQGEVRVVCYKNNEQKLAAMKIYQIAPKTTKKNKDLEDYYKERRMRAHRELIALKKLKDVANVSQITSYSNDFTNIPETEKDAVSGKILYWLIMEYINGCTLEEFVGTYGQINLLDAIKLTKKLLVTVKNIHAKGVVHRDIKPTNLLVSYDRKSAIETAEIYVVDFGLAYIENREDDVDISSFEEKAKYEPTYFGSAMGNRFYRVPQLASASFKELTNKGKNVLLDIRRSPTIDASSICAILFWLITNIEPGLKNRDHFNLAPHQNSEVKNEIKAKIEQQNLLPTLKIQLTNYLVSTFDRGFEYEERQWTIDQLEYRLESILQLFQTKTTSYDQQLSDAMKNMFTFQLTNTIQKFSPIELKFHKISLAYESGKNKFIEKYPLFSWYDGHCHWSQHLQDMTERKNHDILCYQHKKKNSMLIIVCSTHFDDNGDEFTLSIGTDFNGIYVDLPLRICGPRDLDDLNIQLEFEHELIHLLQLISTPMH